MNGITASPRGTDERPGPGLAPCARACPLGVDIPAVLSRLAAGDATGAFLALREANPLPSVCAFVCRHPCLRACIHGPSPRPLPLRWLFQATVARGARPAGLVRGEPTGRRVAVFGAGPAGLAAAHDLALQGHQVRLFDRARVPGGRLARIPSFRLPADALKADLDDLLGLGVEFKPGFALGRDVTLAETLADGYDAIVIAVGTGPAMASHIPGDDLPGIVPAAEFLARAAEGSPLPALGDVVVLGGTSEAFDAARLAARQGSASVTLVYRRTLADLPVPMCEASRAERDGVRLLFLAAPSQFEARSRHVAAVSLQKTVPGMPDAPTRGTAAVGGSDFRIPARTVIVAPSRHSPPDPRAMEGLVLDVDGRPQVDTSTLQTSIPRIHACGDAVLPAPSTATAVASGRQAAAALRRALGACPALPSEPGPLRTQVLCLPDDPDPASTIDAFERAGVEARRCRGQACAREGSLA